MKGWLKLLFLGLLGVGAAELYLRARPSPASSGGAAPAFDLPALDGRSVSLASLRGRVVAVNFWASWCGPCREEIPDLARVYAANRQKCFEMLGVAEESGGREDVAEAARRFGITYPVLVDPKGLTGDAFRIPGYPQTFLIDAEGRIRHAFRGAVDRGSLEDALAPLLAEAPRECPARL
jgi:cytochrome c biogenesis protein CcmG, thiol:disulfide interchange protein DsbE